MTVADEARAEVDYIQDLIDDNAKRSLYENVGVANPRELAEIIVRWQASRPITDEQVETAAIAIVKWRYVSQGVRLEVARRDKRLWRADIEFVTPMARAALEAARGAQS